MSARPPPGGTTRGFLEFLANPWEADDWQADLLRRPGLAEDLALLKRIFPPSWLEVALLAPFKRRPAPFPHQLPYHLYTNGGRTRLLECVAELVRYVDVEDAFAPVPMLGRLRDANLYAPALSELLVGRILRSIGEVTWQPEGSRHGADFRTDHASGVLVAEVKRVWTARRQQAVAMERVSERLAEVPSHQGPVFTVVEEQFNTREDARRLYRRVRYAAGQIAISARNAAEMLGLSSTTVPGVLFLDLDGNSLLTNLDDWIEEWMMHPWASSIDLVVFFNRFGWNATWDTVARPVFSRTDRAWNALERSLGVCSKGHLHASQRLPDRCTLPFL